MTNLLTVPRDVVSNTVNVQTSLFCGKMIENLTTENNIETFVDDVFDIRVISFRYQATSIFECFNVVYRTINQLFLINHQYLEPL